MRVIAVDRDALGARAKIGALAGCDHEPEMLVKPRSLRRTGDSRTLRAAIVPRGLERELFG